MATVINCEGLFRYRRVIVLSFRDAYRRKGVMWIPLGMKHFPPYLEHRP